MDLRGYREQIDDIDRQLVELFRKRLGVCGEIARYKAVSGMPAADPARERQKLDEVSGMAGGELSCYMEELYSAVFAVSRAYESRIIESRDASGDRALKAIRDTPRERPGSSEVS